MDEIKKEEEDSGGGGVGAIERPESDECVNDESSPDKHKLR